MIRILLTSAALIAAAPLAAQTNTAPATPATPANQSANPAMPASPATPSTGSADAAASGSQIAQVVQSEFPSYDADKSGQLDKMEFSKWLTALKEQEMKATGKSLPATEVKAWSEAAFVTADADKSTTVTQIELTTYLGG